MLFANFPNKYEEVKKNQSPIILHFYSKMPRVCATKNAARRDDGERRRGEYFTHKEVNFQLLEDGD